MSWVWRHSFSISGPQALSKSVGLSPLLGTGYGGFWRAIPSFVSVIPPSTGSISSGSRDLPSSKRGQFLGNRAISPHSKVMDVEAELTLAKKKCTPCSSKELRPMTNESATTLLEQVPGWALQEVNGQLQLEKSWKVKNFVKGLEFIKSIGDVAESEGHHPDLHLVNWNDVKANIWTHSVGGLTENDFILAAKINTINTDSFLRKSVKKPATKPPTVAT
jgi:4a-hydroxytetrahydrobiopterin dehydratase